MIKEQVVRPNWDRIASIFWMLLVFMLLILAVCCLNACAPRMCRRTPITITSHPTKPRPAGRVTVGCDDQVVTDILADEVVP